MKWQTHKKKIGYQSKWITLREDEVTMPDGTKGTYNFVDAHDSVMVVPITEKDEIYLIKVWRYPSKRYSWELPGGRTDGEDSQKMAKKELREETGLTAKKWEKIGEFYPLNGLSNELCHVYSAQNLTQTGSNEQDEEAIIQSRVLPLKEVHEMIKSGEIADGQTIASLHLARLRQESKP